MKFPVIQQGDDPNQLPTTVPNLQKIQAREKKNLERLLYECDSARKNERFSEDPVAQLAQGHRMLNCLCDTLEDIADSLPQQFDPEAILQVLEALRGDLPRHFENEETALYPLLLHRGEQYAEMAGLIEQLRMDHASDSLLAQDVADGLEALVERGSHPNTEALGFMLRCFFVALRRNAFWAEHMVLPWAKRLLYPEDFESMRAILVLNRKPK